MREVLVEVPTLVLAPGREFFVAPLAVGVSRLSRLGCGTVRLAFGTVETVPGPAPFGDRVPLAVVVTALLPIPFAPDPADFIETALPTIQFATLAAVFQTPHTVESTPVVTDWVLVVTVLSSVLEEWTLSNAAVVSGASVLACIGELVAAVSRLRGPFGLSDALECSLAVCPVLR